MIKLTGAVTILILLVTPTRAQDRGGVPVIKITQEGSSIKFAVKGSVPIEGVFNQVSTHHRCFRLPWIQPRSPMIASG